MRSDALWELTEPRAPASPTRHAYDWRFDDATVATLARHGIRWWVIVDYAPTWAATSPSLHASPLEPGPYSEYAAALAERYGPGGDFWRDHPELPALPVRDYEVWNEPDTRHFWSPQPEPDRYAVLYAATRAAVHAVQPGARVFTGGLASSTDFVSAMVAVRPQLAGGEVDAVAIHPYGKTPAAVLAHVADQRAALRRAGLGNVPLGVTEVGWQIPTTTGAFAPDARYPASPARRARWLRELVPALVRSGCDVTAVLPYAWTTTMADPAAGDDWYGLVPPRGGPTAGSVALGRALAVAQLQRPSRRRACR